MGTWRVFKIIKRATNNGVRTEEQEITANMSKEDADFTVRQYTKAQRGARTHPLKEITYEARQNP